MISVSAQLRHLLANIPLRWVLVVPFVLQTMAAVGLIGYLSYRSGQRAVADLANQLIIEVGNSIDQNLTDYLHSPPEITQSNAAAIKLGILNWQDFATLKQYFEKQLDIYDISSVGIITDPSKVLVIRQQDNGSRVMQLSDASTGYALENRLIDRRGNLIRQLERPPAFTFRKTLLSDPDNPQMRKAGDSIWQLHLVAIGSQPPVLTAAYFLPFSDPNNTLRGRLTASISLTGISTFLQNLDIGKTGQAFVIDRTGNIVGTSTGEVLARLPSYPHRSGSQPDPAVQSVASPASRLSVLESRNPLTQSVAQALIQRFGQFDRVSTSQLFTVQLQGQRYFVQICPFEQEEDLDWLRVVVVPESDFTTEIDTNHRRTLVLCGLTFLGTTALGILASRWLTQPILRLNQASRALAQGTWQQPPLEDFSVKELKTLTTSFNQTAAYLQQSLSHAKVALYESQEKFAKIFRSSPDAITIVNQLDGRYLEVNDQFVLITGYSRQEVIGRTALELDLIVKPEQLVEIRQCLHRQQVLCNFEIELRTKSGAIKTGLMSSELIDLDDYSCVLSIFKDYTDRKQSEAALRANEEQLRIALDAAQMGVWDWHLPTGKITWSENLERMFGMAAGEFDGCHETFVAKLHPEDREQVLQSIQTAIESGSDYQSEFRIVWSDGTVHWAYSKGRVFSDDAGRPIRMAGINMDITDRKRTEAELYFNAEALQRSEATNRALIQAIPDLLIRMRRDGTYLDIRHSDNVKLFAPESSQIGARLNTILPPSAVQERMNYTEEVLRTRQVVTYEQQLMIQNSLYYEEVRIVPCGEDDVLVIVRDITERKKIEHQLELQSIVVKNVAEGICLIRAADGTIVYANPRFERMFGYDPGELVGQHTAVLNYQAQQTDPNATYHYLANQIISRGEATYEVYNVKKDGTPFWCQAVASTFEHPEHGAVLVAVQQDITERKQAEETLKRQFAIIESAIDGIAILENERYTYLNTAHLKMFGYETPEELIGKSWRQLYAAQEIQRFDQEIFPSLRQKRYWQGETIATRRDGSTFAQELSLTLTENDSLICVCRDMSDRYKLDQMKDEFISVVSHELRTPLTAIRGSLGILETGVLDNRPEKAKHMLQVALNNSERLVRLVNDILNLERLESGKVQLVMEPCRVADLLQQSIEAVQEIAAQSSITLHLTPLDAEVWAAPDAIVQTLTNLLSNAIKFSSPGSEVWLSAAHLDLSKQEKQDIEAPYSCCYPFHSTSYILFSIQDRGRGIPADKLESIFGRFQQVDVSDSRQKGGTGLGLAICKSIVQQHGGQIWAKSILGQGSTFYFVLPVNQSRAGCSSGYGTGWSNG